MRNRNLTITLLLIVQNIFGQINAHIKNKVTDEPIKYVNVWITNEVTGTSSDENGHFTIKPKNDSNKIIFSAVGYETKTILVSEIHEIIYLNPITYELNEVQIAIRKNKKEFKIGNVKESNVDVYFGANSKYPWIIAKYFPYDPKYEQNRFIKKISFLTGANKNLKFNIRLYSIGQNKKPGQYIAKDNIIVNAKKGYKKTTVDLSHLNIAFPEDGFFIAIENIEDNSQSLVLGLDLSLPKENSLIYYKGDWLEEVESKNMLGDKMINLFKATMFELTLSD